MSQEQQEELPLRVKVAQALGWTSFTQVDGLWWGKDKTAHWNPVPEYDTDPSIWGDEATDPRFMCEAVITLYRAKKEPNQSL